MYNKEHLIVFSLMLGSNLMAITEKEKQTIAFYDQKAETFIGSLGPDEGQSFWKNEIKILQSFVPNGRILDIGVGKGKEAKMLINANYDYVGVEPAAGLKERLEKLFPSGFFIGDTVYNWTLEQDSFDGFWCSAMLLHVPRENIDQVLQQIKKVMKTGAPGFISLAEGSSEYFDENSGRYFYLYGQDEFSEILKRNGFVIEKQNIRKHKTHKHWLRSWLTYFVTVKK